MLVVLDPGHGKDTPGKRSPDGSLREYEFNQTVAEIAAKMLKNYDINVILTKQMNDPDISLNKRAEIANKNNADIFISIHANAYGNGSTWTTANGYEVYHYPNSNIGYKLAKIAHKYAIQKTKIRDRGIKSANFAVLRLTNMPAILIEFGFMTHKEEVKLLKSEQYRVACAESIVLTCLEWFGLTQNKSLQGTPILGQPELTPSQLKFFVLEVNSNAPEVADYYIELGKQMNIRGDIAFCQAILETNWFRYGGDVKPNQNNYCGLGAVGQGAKGASFPSPRQGVLAHLQHLWAYATTEPLSDQNIIDPRFHLVKRGSATTWESLSGKWAVPGYDRNKYSSLEEAMKNNDTYGHHILNVYKEMKKVKKVESEQFTDGADLINNKTVENKEVLFTITNIDGQKIPSVVIDNKGYIRVTDIGAKFGYSAIYNKLTKEISLVNKRDQ